MSLPIIPKALSVPTTPTPKPTGFVQQFLSLFSTKWSQEKINQAVDTQKRELLKALVALDDPLVRGKFGDQKIRDQLRIIETRVHQVLPTTSKTGKEIKNVEGWIHELENELVESSSPNKEKLEICNGLRTLIGATLANPQLNKHLGKEEQQFLNQLQHTPIFKVKEEKIAALIMQNAMKKAAEEQESIANPKMEKLSEEIQQLEVKAQQMQPAEMGNVSVKERATLLELKQQKTGTTQQVNTASQQARIQQQISEKRKEFQIIRSTVRSIENIQVRLGLTLQKFDQLIPGEIRNWIARTSASKAVPAQNATVQRMNREITEVAYKIADRQDLNEGQKNRLFQNVKGIIEYRYAPIIDEKGEQTTLFGTLQTPTKVAFNRILEQVKKELPYNDLDFEKDMAQCELVVKNLSQKLFLNQNLQSVIEQCVSIYPKVNQTLAQRDAISFLSQIGEKTYTTAESQREAIKAVETFIQNHAREFQKRDPEKYAGLSIRLGWSKAYYLLVLPESTRGVIGGPDQKQTADPETVDLAYAIADREDLNRDEKSELFNCLRAVEELKASYTFNDQGKKTTLYAELDPKLRNEVEWIFNRLRHGDPYLEGTSFSNDLHTLQEAVRTVRPNVQELKTTIGGAIHDLLAVCANDPFFSQIQPRNESQQTGWKGKEQFDHLLRMDPRDIGNRLPHSLKQVEELLQIFLPTHGSVPFKPETVAFVQSELANIRKQCNKLPSDIQGLLTDGLTTTPQDPVAFERTIVLAKKIEKRDDIGPEQKMRLLGCLDRMVLMKRTGIVGAQGRIISPFELLPTQDKNVLELLLKQVEEGIPFSSADQFDFMLYQASKALQYGQGIQDAFVAEFKRAHNLLLSSKDLKLQPDEKESLSEVVAQLERGAMGLQQAIGLVREIIDSRGAKIGEDKTVLKVKAQLYALEAKQRELVLPENVYKFIGQAAHQPLRPEDKILLPIAKQIHNQTNLFMNDKKDLFNLAKVIVIIKNNTVLNEQGKEVPFEQMLTPQNRAVVDRFFKEISEGKVYLSSEEFQADRETVTKALAHFTNIFEVNKRLHETVAVGLGATAKEQALFKQHLFKPGEYEELVKISKTTYTDVEKLAAAMKRAEVLLKAAGQRGVQLNEDKQVQLGEEKFQKILTGFQALEKNYQGKFVPETLQKMTQVPPDLSKLVPHIANRQDLNLVQKNRLFNCVREIINLKQTPTYTAKGTIEPEYAQLTPENKKPIEQLLQKVEKGNPFTSEDAFEKEMQQIDSAILQASPPIVSFETLNSELKKEIQLALQSDEIQMNEADREKLEGIVANPARDMKQLSLNITTLSRIIQPIRHRDPSNPLVVQIDVMRKRLSELPPDNFDEYQNDLSANRDLIALGRAICRRRGLSREQKGNLFDAAGGLYEYKNREEYKQVPNEKKKELEALLAGIHKGTTTSKQIENWERALIGEEVNTETQRREEFPKELKVIDY